MKPLLQKFAHIAFYLFVVAFVCYVYKLPPFQRSHIEGSWLKSSGAGPAAVTIRQRSNSVEIKTDGSMTSDIMTVDIPFDGMEHASSSEHQTWYSASLNKDDLMIKKRILLEVPIRPFETVSETRWHSPDGSSMTYTADGRTGEYVRPSLRYRLFRALP